MKKIHQNSLVWLRRDLRLEDNPALTHALSNSENTFIVFIYSPDEESPWEMGGASKWWLHHSLSKLSEDILSLGGNLNIIKSNDSLDTIREIIKKEKIDLVCWNRLYDPQVVARDTKIKSSLTEDNIKVESFSSHLLKEPWELKTTTKKPYQVFTPFWNNLRSCINKIELEKKPKDLTSSKLVLKNSIKNLKELKLLPKIPWDKEFYNHWQPGEDGAIKILKTFIKSKLENYKIDRDFPDRLGNSSLSPHLHFGEITPRKIWYVITNSDIRSEIAEPFLRQLGWRDFAHHLLFNFPHTTEKPLRAEFSKFPWAKDKSNLKKWQKGNTGFPIVDAGMRELWQSGTMHNRVRMIVGSILVKNFLIHWHEGAKWFWDCLLDADLANNTLGWQWIAGCGADAAPYFRIFNPVSQSEKFDPSGNYIRTWVPELKNLPNKWIHKPWEAPENILKTANLNLGSDYPLPAVDLKASREIALESYYGLKLRG